VMTQDDAVVALRTKSLAKAAMAKLGKLTSDDRAALTVGDHEVDVVVRIKGKVNVQADVATHQVNLIDAWALLKLALDKLNGVTVESIVDEALSAMENGDELDDGGLKAFTMLHLERLERITHKVRSGAVSFTGSYGVEIGGDK
jgi:hypothetical protein